MKNDLTSFEKDEIRTNLRTFIDETQMIKKGFNDHAQSDAVNFALINESMANMEKKLDVFISKVEPLIIKFGNAQWGTKMLVNLGMFLGGFVTFIIGVVEIIKMFNHR